MNTREINLEVLKKEIPCKWRVQSFSKFKPQGQCVAYIDARDVMDLLDEAVGAENWQSDFKDCGGQLFAGVGINDGKGWIWKWDTGSESNIEKEKGEASDSFKRAAVKWGIGRFLYNLEIKYVKANELKTKDNFPYVIDEQGQRVWNLTEYINRQTPKRETQNKQEAPLADPRTNTIKLLLASLGHFPKTFQEAGSVVLELTDCNFAETQYDLIIKKLQDKVKAFEDFKKDAESQINEK